MILAIVFSDHFCQTLMIIIKAPVRDIIFIMLNDVTVPCCFSSNSVGEWSSSGCNVVRSDNLTTVCSCNHLTGFALLMQVDDAPSVSFSIYKKACSMKMYKIFLLFWHYICFMRIVQSLLSGRENNRIPWRRSPRVVPFDTMTHKTWYSLNNLRSLVPWAVHAHDNLFYPRHSHYLHGLVNYIKFILISGERWTQACTKLYYLHWMCILSSWWSSYCAGVYHTNVSLRSNGVILFTSYTGGRCNLLKKERQVKM